MKKFYLIILSLLICSHLFAEVKISESGMIEDTYLNEIYKEKLKKSQKKKKNLIYYLSIGQGGSWSNGYRFSKEINDTEHEKAYKNCIKGAKKHTQNDCFLYAINDKIEWDFAKSNTVIKDKKIILIEDKIIDDKIIIDDKTFILTQNYSDDEVKRRIKEKLILSYKDNPEFNYIKEEDDKVGRSLYDRPDVSDDYQIHFIYLLNNESKDKELDTNGFIEELAIKANDKLLEITAKNKRSNGIGQKFKYDLTKDGKLDVSFVRTKFSNKELAEDKYDGITSQGFYDYVYNLGFNNPKKIYVILAGFYSLRGKNIGGEAGPGYAIIFMNHCKSLKNCGKIMLHEAFHSNGAVYGCGKGAKHGHMKKNSDLMGSNSNGYKIDSKNDSYYRHSIERCPDLANSVYLTPTSKNSWDPYDVFCRANYKNFTHKKAFDFPGARNGRMCKIKKLILIQ